MKTLDEIYRVRSWEQKKGWPSLLNVATWGLIACWCAYALGWLAAKLF